LSRSFFFNSKLYSGLIKAKGPVSVLSSAPTISDWLVCGRNQLDSGKGHDLIGEDRFCLYSVYFKFKAIYLGSIKITGRPVGALGSAPTII
jgi:hypothetical protein